MHTTMARESADSNFTLAFAVAVLLAVGSAVVLTPFASAGLALAGFHFPFPRIFDRVVMVAALGTLILFARRLRLFELVRSGFAEPRRHLRSLLIGFALALALMIGLFALAAWTATRPIPLGALFGRALRFGGAAFLIAVIEETFFRALLLAGMAHDFGRRPALIVSAALYAIVHLIRSPRHYYLTGLHPLAGLANLQASAVRIIHPDGLLPMVFGLFLLGLVLGLGFLLSGRVYFSIGLHAGLIIAAKCWSVVAHASDHIPAWLAGAGPVPLIAAPAAWLFSLALIALMPRFLGPNRSTTPVLRRS